MISSKIQAEQDILDQVKSIFGDDAFPGIYTPDFYVPEKDAMGNFPPYAAVAFGTTYKTSDKHITTNRDDPLRASVIVYVVGPNDYIARQYRTLVEDALIGFTPTDSGELYIEGGYNFQDSDIGLHRFIYAVNFKFITNLESN